ncbi:hypothetical protein [Plantactinospora sp. GCM10030261]|uniref:hypothetical protein n=1 Tax=Plantactinospora sp. GCM10030261 TaxID=3273420 RepID=UPI0036133162
MGSGGTDVDFWRERAAAVRADGGRGDGSADLDLERLAAARRYERIYSAAARMLAAQAHSTRGSWPNVRRQRWRELETLLAEVPAVTSEPGVADPSWQLAGRLDEAGRAVDMAQAASAWKHQLGIAPTATQVASPVDQEPASMAVVLRSSLYLVVSHLLEELAQRLAPGRPVAAVGHGGADLGEVSRELARQIWSAATGQRVTAQPARSPVLAAPRPLSTGLPLPGAVERLATAARLAAEATPAPGRDGRDDSVRPAAATAAADLLAGLRRPDGPSWRERYDGIRPDVHMVSSYRWEGAAGRPVELAEQAAEIRAMTHDLPAPRGIDSEDEIPDSTAEQGWMLLPNAAALITAELLDELAVRLRPGQWIGTIRFTAIALPDLVRGRLRSAAIGT